MKTINIIIADDHKFWRESMAAALTEEAKHVNVSALAENGLDLLKILEDSRPDIILLDLRMPGLSGLEALEIIKEKYPTIKTIVVSAEVSDYRIARSILDGARAYLCKTDVDIKTVIRAINNVSADGYFFNGVISREIVEELHRNKKLYYVLDNERFTQRDIDVLNMLCKDMTRVQMADNLKISEDTLRFHQGNLMRKTECETLTALIKYAIRQGIINGFER